MNMPYFIRTNLRNIFFNRRFAFLHIIGLSIGVTVSLLILLYLNYELSFDKFNPHTKNIYRIITKNNQDGSLRSSTPLALSDILKKDFPEIEKVVALLGTWDVLKVSGERYNNLRGAIVEKEFFQLFNLPFTTGNQQQIFSSPFEAVITQKLSSQLYGNENPVGKTFEYENQLFTVSGIIQNIPSNSLFAELDYFLSDGFRYKSYPDLNQRWYHFGLYTFITFKGNKGPGNIEKRLASIQDRYYPDFMKNRHEYKVSAFEGSHLNPALENDLTSPVAPVYLWILSIIAIGILIIACLNFINISVANSTKKHTVSGIKKVLGAARSSLILEIFSEISFIVFVSLILSILSMFYFLPAFNTLMGKNVVLNFSDPVFWLGILAVGLFTILFSSFYPAFSLSKTSTLKVLLNKKIALSGDITFQKGFVVLQFSITIVLLISLLFIGKQIKFLQNHEVGFDKDNLITIPVEAIGNNSAARLTKTNVFVQTIEKYQAQMGYGKPSITEFVPGFGFRNQFKIFPQDEAYSDGMELLSCDVDENYQEVYGLKVIEGRFFSKSRPADTDALIINETAYKKLGWKSVEGKWVGLFSKDYKKEIIGVVSDINVMSLHNPIGPMIYQFGPHHMYPGFVTLRIKPDNKAASVALLKNQWLKLFPDIPFEYESIAEKYKAAYGQETKLIKTIAIFSLIAMALSLLGIMALSALECDQRIKEIGIRRVNGAKSIEVMSMLNQDFIKWVAIAFLLACPIAWYAMRKWLENFAYKTDLSWWVFAAAGGIAMVIALATVSWQSWRAATRNPVESLRYE